MSGAAGSRWFLLDPAAVVHQLCRLLAAPVVVSGPCRQGLLGALSHDQADGDTENGDQGRDEPLHGYLLVGGKPR